MVLKFVVSAEGTAEEIEVYAADPEGIFEKSAIDALKKYQFSPAMKDGKHVDTIVKIPIAFAMDKGTLSEYFNEILKNSQKMMEDGYYELAIDNLNTAIDIYKKHSPTFYLRGTSYRATGKYKKALSGLCQPWILLRQIESYWQYLL